MKSALPQWVLAAVAVTLSLAGCSASTTPPEAASSAAAIPPYPAEDRFVQCMNDAGWQMQRSLTSPPSVDNVPDEQRSAFDATSVTCGDESGYTQSQNLTAWSEAQKKQLFSQEVENHACITGRGLASDAPPSEAVFLETVGSSQGWYQAINAYLKSGNINGKEYADLLQACPPPLMFMSIDGF